MVDLQAYTSAKRRSFWAFKAAWNRKEVQDMMIQFMKKDELVIDSSQLNAVVPPADFWSQHYSCVVMG